MKNFWRSDMLNARQVLLLSTLLFPSAVFAAETVHLTLSSPSGQIEGDSTQTSLGREDTIECVLFRYSMRATSTSTQAGTFTCRKRLDKATPLLLKALIQKEALTMTARFFRPNPTGDGTTEQFYTVGGQHGRLVSIKQLSPDTLAPASSTVPAFEELTFEFGALSFTWTNGGTSMEWQSAR